MENEGQGRTVSVCIAAYNGEKYITEQLVSILAQLRPEDEVIIVDDCSKDKTLDKVRSLNDPRIRIYSNRQNMGEVFTFGYAVSLAVNDVIFMADQDDIWNDGRVSLMIENLSENKAMLVSSNTDFINSSGEKIDYRVKQLIRQDSSRTLKNIISILTGITGYYGCAMAFDHSLRKIILPIPAWVESHDLWIALAGNIAGSNSHIDEKTLRRRIHGNNASIIKRNLFLKIRSRLIHIFSIIILLYRAKIKIRSLK